MAPVTLTLSKTLVPYSQALATMEQQVNALITGRGGEGLWLLEHPPLYTAGTSARPQDLLGTQPLPVYTAGRGGQYTYHGPGQRVAYLVLDVAKRDRDVRAFVSAIEGWVTAALGEFSVQARSVPNRVGLWVPTPEGVEAKIAAIGIRLRKWVSFHGVAINVAPNLHHFEGIVPCGLREAGVTSLEALGLAVTLPDLDGALIKHFEAFFDAPLTAAQDGDR